MHFHWGLVIISIFEMTFLHKVTIIWAPQSGTSAEGASRMVPVPHSRAVGVQLESLMEHRELPQQGHGRRPSRQQFFMVTLWNRADHYIFILWFLLLSFFFMAALCNRAGHYIFALWFLSSFFFFLLLFFLAKSQRPQIGCLPYFGTEAIWIGSKSNLAKLMTRDCSI